MNSTKKITISLTEDIYQHTKTEAELCDMSMSAYVKRKLTDKSDTIRLQKEAAAVMAKLYDLAVKTEDLYVREQLRKYGDELCRCLK